MNPAIRKLARIVLPLLVLVVSVMGARALIATKPQAERKAPQSTGTVVETHVVEVGDHRVQVQAQGTVVPAREVQLQAQVSGRVRWLSPKLVAGGRVRAGELLMRIDPRDYQLAVAQQKGQLDKARLDLELEQSRKAVAEREWELFAEDMPQASADGLALREPQLRTAKVALESAESSLQQAKVQLDRTVVRAPFNALVRSEAIELGQLVTPNANLGSLVGSDAFWVQVSLPLSDLQWLKIPGVNAEEGSPARVVQEVGSRRVVREGRVIRLLGELDPVGRMARVLVEVNDPLGAEAANEGKVTGLPLLLGAYVDLTLQGKRLERAAEIPRTALHEGRYVHVVSPAQTLELRSVDIAYRGPETAFVTRGLAAGERIVTSHIAAPVEGMRLRLLSAGAAEPPHDGSEAQAQGAGEAPAADGRDEAAEERQR